MSISLPFSLSKALVLGALSTTCFGFAFLGGSFSSPKISSEPPFFELLLLVERPFLGWQVGLPAQAQQVSPERRNAFLSDPLTAVPRDPLLPVLAVDRAYSPLELSELTRQLDRLNQNAQQLLTNGQPEEAFELWLREVRLRRVLGPAEEFVAIRRVAAIAWEQQRAVAVQLLTLRTREIWQTVGAALTHFSDEAADADESVADESDADESDETLGQDPPESLAGNPEQILVAGDRASDAALLQSLAQTFAILRDIDSSVEVYQQLISLTVAQSGDATPQQKELADLHLDWFQFAAAADVYLALLKEARATGNQAQETDTLQRLVYSYQQADSFTNAVRAQTDLLGIYQAQGDEEKLPGLLVAIAQNYRTLNQPSNAITYYRSAYSVAQRFEQFSISAQVLKDLGLLYETLALNDEALGAYNLLVPVEQQAYNNYGIMNAYDSIGQLHRKQGNDFEALQAFEKALVIANRLGIQEDYFIEQIRSVT
ncbi:MAG: hypothetical protein AAFV90_03420 [Cyanobacteria bacterium J06634_5]